MNLCDEIESKIDSGSISLQFKIIIFPSTVSVEDQDVQKL